MSMTYAEARDAMFTVVKDTWEANASTIFGSAGELWFQNVEKRTPPDQGTPWCHAEQMITTTRQLGLRNGGLQLYTTVGMLAVDIYSPRVTANAASAALAMADKMRRAFEGTRLTSAWFRNVTATPTGNTAGFVVVRVMADFEYTEEGESDG
jgi:hypothetical protein